MRAQPHIIVIVMTYFLAVLSVAAGVPKLLQMPQELAFLNALGFNALVVSALGVVQVSGGILIIRTRSRLVGAVLAGLALAISSIAIFLGGNTEFGLVSLLPVAVSIIVIYSTLGSAERRDA